MPQFSLQYFMKKCIFICTLSCALLLGVIQVSAAGETDSVKSARLEVLRHFIANEIGLNTGDEFYTRWSENPVSLSYVYISRNDTLAPPATVDRFIYAGEDSLKADSICRHYASAGYSVMHYRTAGTSAAKMNEVLWNYPAEAFVFIVIHEAVHVHLRIAEIKLRYEYEEALGDAVANFYTPVFLHSDRSEHKAAVKQQHIIEKLYSDIAHLEQKFYHTHADHARLFSVAQHHIFQLAMRGNRFQHDRFLYPVNEAYLMRYHSYVYRYHFLADKLRHGESAAGIIEELKTL